MRGRGAPPGGGGPSPGAGAPPVGAPRHPPRPRGGAKPVRSPDLEERRLGLIPQTFGAVEGDEPTPVHEREAMAVLGLFHVVRGDEDRGPLRGEIVDELPEAPAGEALYSASWRL